MFPETPSEKTAASDPSPSPSPHEYDWQVHEHVAESAKSTAQALVEEVGSVGLAKQAVEAVGAAISNLQTDETRKDTLHESLGFISREDLDRASTPVESTDGQNWFLTELSPHAWVAWNVQQPQIDRHFYNREGALASIPRDVTLCGSTLLG